MAKKYAKISFNVDTRLENGKYINDDNLIDTYKNNPEYKQMISSGNFYEATKEEYQTCCEKQMCVVNGKLQEYVLPDDIKLQNAKNAKLVELNSFYNNGVSWRVTLQDGSDSLTAELTWLRNTISTNPFFYNDSGNLVSKSFSVEKVFEIKDLLNNKGIEFQSCQKTIISDIENASLISEIHLINIQSRFDEINKIILIA